MTRRVLHSIDVDGPVAVVSRPAHVLDDATRDLIERERAAARAQGVTEGRAAAIEQARAEAAAVAAAVDVAARQLSTTLAAQHAALADALATRVLDGVRAVLGREPDDDGHALVGRLHEVVARTDEPELVVRVAHGREVVAAEALAGRAGVRVEVDDALGPDDAVVTGSFASADLRVERLLAALDELLADQPPLGPIAAPDEEVAP